MSPVHYAAMRSHEPAVRMLWAQGASADIKAWSMMVQSELTPLHLAAQAGSIEIVDFLISSGVRVDVSTSRGETPIHTAAVNGKLEMVKFLIENGVDEAAKTNVGKEYCQIALENGHQSIVDFYIERNGVNGKVQEKLFFAAAERGNMQTIEKLISEMDPNIEDEYGRTPLHAAAATGMNEVGAFLIENAADPDWQDKVCLLFIRETLRYMKL